MNIPSALPSLAATPVGVVESTAGAPAASSTEAATEVGPATTWWISPPGQYFSVLNQIAEEYPVELKLALEHFAEASSSATTPGETTLASIASEVAHGTPPARRRAPPLGAAYAPAVTAPVVTPSPLVASGVHALLPAMQRLAHDAPSVFQDISSGLASSFQSVAGGSGTLAMATLAAQLQQAATMVTGDPPARSSPLSAPAVPAPVAPIAAVVGIDGEPTRTPDVTG